MTERWLGEHRPNSTARSSARVDAAAHARPGENGRAAANIVTVIAEEHGVLASAVPAPFPGTLVRQPSNRGTAVGVFLPLAYVLERDPNATVMVSRYHFIYPEGRFLQYVMASYCLCRGLQDSLLLLAVPATSVETDYGWIEANAPASSPIAPLRPIERLIEKPSAEPPSSVAAACGTPWWSRPVPPRSGSSAGGSFPT